MTYDSDTHGSLEEIAVIGAAKRCGVQWAPWMGDWFTSWSPRNGNSSAEGTWEHWVDLALSILADPMTKLVRPDVHIDGPRLVAGYDQTVRCLSDAELGERFKGDLT